MKMSFTKPLTWIIALFFLIITIGGCSQTQTTSAGTIGNLTGYGIYGIENMTHVNSDAFYYNNGTELVNSAGGVDTTCDGETCNIANTGTLDGYEASALLDDTDTWNTTTQMRTAVNSSTEFYIIDVDKLDGEDATSFQDDIGSDCPAGDYVKGVDDDGTLDCSTPAGDGGVSAADVAALAPNATAGTGISISGQVVSFDATWGDARYENGSEGVTYTNASFNTASIPNGAGYFNDEANISCTSISGLSAGLCDGSDADTTYTASDFTATYDSRYVNVSESDAGLSLSGQALSLVVLKDLVAGTGLSGGSNNVFTGADADVTVSLDTSYTDARYAGNSSLTAANVASIAPNVTESDTYLSLSGQALSFLASNFISFIDGRYSGNSTITASAVAALAPNQTAGNGLTLTGTVFSHNDTSSVSNSDNSGGTFIQDLTFDAYGHVATLATSTALISGGTLTSAYVCRYDGAGIDCDLVTDGSGACSAGAVCTGGHTHAGVNEIYGSGWNGDTATPEKDDVYDWGHLFDTDDDGKVNVLDLTAGLVKTDASGIVSTASSGTDYSNIGNTIEYTEITATTSANWAGKITDESGTGVFAFTTSPSFTTPSLGAATATTLDTGQGANELYDMDQNVLTTSSPTFVNVTSINCIVFDSGGTICSGS